MKKNIPTFRVLAVAAVLLVLAGCNSLSRDAESSSMIVINSLQGTSHEGDIVGFLDSDVLGEGGAIQADAATANITVRLINPDPVNGPSQFNDVVLTRYAVTFELTTGPGTPGTDVPMPFEGYFSTTRCEVDQETSVPFVVVTENAKQAAPLAGLVGTTNVLERRAKIEIFGEDMTGKPVTATGYLTVYFGDYQAVLPTVKK